jgi:phage antirepressor YoqD-like protein
MNINKEFKYFNGQKFVVVVDDNHTNWYLGTDVAIILGYSSPSSAINNCKNAIIKTDLCDLISDSNVKLDLDFNYRTHTKFIPSLDVTALADKSPNQNKDEIDRFKNWLNNVVNVEIAKDLVPATLEQLIPVSHLISMTTALNNALDKFDISERRNEIFINTITSLQQENIVLRQDSNKYQQEAISNKKEADLNAEKAEVYEGKADKFAEVVGRLAPKAKIYDQIAARKDLLTMEQTAKLISERFPHAPNANVIGRNTLLRVLRAKNALTTKNIATQAMVSAGYFTLKYSTFEGETYPSSTLVTPKGVEYIINVAKEFRYLPDISCPDVEEARQWAAMLKAAQPQSSTTV